MFTQKIFYWQIIKKITPAIIVISVAFLAINYFKSATNQILIDIEQQQNLAFVLANRSQTAIRLKEDFAKIGNPEEKIINARLPVDNILEFSSSLDSLGIRYSLPQMVSFSPPVDEFQVDFGINLTANAFSLINYLQSFETLPYLAKINTVSLSTTGRNWDEVSNITIGGKLFTRPSVY